MQLHSIARLNAIGVAGERVDLVVFFVGDSHAVRDRVYTARNRSLFRIVNRNDDDDYHYRSGGNDCSDYVPGCDTADWAVVRTG